jgi:hypothetical protein
LLIKDEGFSAESVLLFQQSLLKSIPHQGGAARQTELGHEPGLVGLDRLDAEAKPVTHLQVGVAQGDQPQHLLLAGTEQLVAGVGRLRARRRGWCSTQQQTGVLRMEVGAASSTARR